MAGLKAWPWAAAALSGVLLTLCFPPWNQGWLCWIALTPLISALFFAPVPDRRFLLRQAALGYVTGFVFIGSSFYWLSTTLAELYDNRWLFALAPLVAVVLGLYVAFWGWLVSFLVRPRGERPRFPRSLSNLGIACGGASAWVVHEWVRERLFGGFGWNPLGVALHRDLPMIQIAEFTGTPGLSFLVAFTNLMAVIIVRRIIGELGPVFLKRIRWEFSLTMALIAAVFAFGIRQLLHPDSGPTVPLRVVAVQPNIAQADKFDRDAEEKVLAQIEQLTSLATAATPPPQLVLWPESALPSGMFASERNYRFVVDQVRRGDFALLLGTIDFDPQRAEDYNTALLLTERGQRQQSYRKIHLVPFGEYLPLRPVFAGFVGQLVPGDFTPGREPTVLALSDPAVKLGPLVCFEDTLGDLTRRFVQNGAQILVNITNDGWFAQSPAAEQHLANATLRAVENRRPLIRCGNTGISCGINATGHVDRWLPAFQQGFAAREIAVPVQPRLTFYSRHGDWFCTVTGVIVLLATLLTWKRPSTHP
jgi:apolipoprotein N-acyltransferase